MGFFFFFFFFLCTDPISDVEFKYHCQPISESDPIWYIQPVKVLF